jgi:hypothetical protein
MKKLSNYSKKIHVVAICCFLLPFFYVGCDDDKKKVIETADTVSATVLADSIAEKQEDSSVVIQDTIIEQTVIIDTVTTQENDEEKSDLISIQISKKYTFLQPILVSNNNNTFSGIATVIDGLYRTPFFATFLSFLFLLLGLLLKFIEPQATKAISLMNIIAFAALTISVPMALYSERLWGYYVALIVVGILMILDLYILRKIRKDCLMIK